MRPSMLSRVPDLDRAFASDSPTITASSTLPRAAVHRRESFDASSTLANDAFPAVFGRIVDNGNFDILGTDADDDFLFYLAAFSDQADQIASLNPNHSERPFFGHALKGPRELIARADK